METVLFSPKSNDMSFNKRDLLKEISYKAALSSGPGGQHANKASTKVILEWNLEDTALFAEEQLTRLRQKLASHLTKENVLQLACEETRSQHNNKKIVTERFLQLIQSALKKPKKRKKPKPGKKFHKKRLEEKKRKAEKKANRKDPLK